ncbi:MAG TPA: hypothetical protein VHJ77_09725 [Vicinamibacterales bacterium]|jgi:hypothetical protein|nr:hypothetical protein [Vicinamibacterales bacterium]
MYRVLAIGIAAALTANCASTPRAATGYAAEPFAHSTKPQDPPALVAAYVKALPAGAKIKVTMVDGETLQATLMALQEDAIIVRPRTRIPEPAQTIPLQRIASVEVQQPNGGLGRAIAIGAGVGAGAAIGVFLAIAVLLSD